MGPHTNGHGRARSQGRRKTNDAQRILDAIRRIVQSLRVASRASEKQLGLSAAQLFVLQKLGESRAASLNELAAKTLTHQSSVSVVVQRLATRGLIERSASTLDARRVVLALTPKGRALIKRSPQAAQERLINGILKIAPSRRQQLADMLESIAAEAGQEAPPPALFFEESSTHNKGKANGSR